MNPYRVDTERLCCKHESLHYNRTVVHGVRAFLYENDEHTWGTIERVGAIRCRCDELVACDYCRVHAAYAVAQLLVGHSDDDRVLLSATCWSPCSSFAYLFYHLFGRHLIRIERSAAPSFHDGLYNFVHCLHDYWFEIVGFCLLLYVAKVIK